jgi:uncharacterized protein YcfJ
VTGEKVTGDHVGEKVTGDHVGEEVTGDHVGEKVTGDHVGERVLPNQERHTTASRTVSPRNKKVITFFISFYYPNRSQKENAI